MIFYVLKIKCPTPHRCHWALPKLILLLPPASEKIEPGSERSVRHQFIHPNISVSLFFPSPVLHFRMLPGAHPWRKFVGGGVKSWFFFETQFGDFLPSLAWNVLTAIGWCRSGMCCWEKWPSFVPLETPGIWTTGASKEGGQIMKNILSLQRCPHCRGPRNQQVLLEEHHSSNIVFGIM